MWSPGPRHLAVWEPGTASGRRYHRKKRHAMMALSGLSHSRDDQFIDQENYEVGDRPSPFGALCDTRSPSGGYPT